MKDIKTKKADKINGKKMTQTINEKDLQKYIENGASLTSDLKPIKKTRGFMVSRLGYEMTYKPTQTDDIKRKIVEYSKLLSNNEFVGIRQYEGLVYIDISKHYTKKDKAIKTGIKNKQYSIYNIATGKDIPLVKKTLILYRYNEVRNDLIYVKEFMSLEDAKNELKMTRDTIKHYIIKSIGIDSEKRYINEGKINIKSLINNKYLLAESYIYYRDIEEGNI